MSLGVTMQNSKLVALIKRAWRRSLNTPGLLLLGMLVRLWLMTFAGHHDAFFIPWMSNWVADGHWQIYTFFRLLKKSTASHIDTIWLSNPPLTYFTIASWIKLWRLTGLLPTTGWNYFTTSQWNIVHPQRMLLLTKSLYLIFDMGTLWGLLKLVNQKQRFLVAAAWMLSPILLFDTYVMGQTDIFPVFWVVMALLAAKRGIELPPSRWRWLSLLLLGIGGAYKLWPLILVPVFSLVLARDFWRRIGMGLVGVFPLLLTSAPYLTHKAFRIWVLKGHNQNLIVGYWNSQDIIPYFVFYMSVLFALYFLDRKWTFNDLVLAGVALMFGLFTINRNWEFYWLLWMLPFSVLALVRFPKGWLLYFYQAVHCFLYLTTVWGALEGNVFYPRIPFDGELLSIGEALWGSIKPPIAPLLVSFSIFVVATWGLLIFPFLHRWQANNNELSRGKEKIDDRIPSLLGWLQLLLFLGIYVLMTFAPVRFASERIAGIFNGYWNALVDDPFLILVWSLSLIFILLVVAGKIKTAIHKAYAC